MRRFKSARHVQRFASVHGLVQNPFPVGRHLLRSANHRVLRMRRSSIGRRRSAFAERAQVIGLEGERSAPSSST